MTPRELSHSEFVDWLRLTRTPRIGPVNFHRLLVRYGSAGRALHALPELARERNLPPPNLPDRDDIEREIENTLGLGFDMQASCAPDYPAALTCIPDPPPVLITRGRTALMHAPACAIVGARNASAAGLRFARELAAGLGAAGFTVISGMARGIDGAAHQGALQTGTVAVLAGGPDHLYPPDHADLRDAIAETGLILSEMPVGFAPVARDFPRRNRLVSGLSLGTLVVEAAPRSGSLITARLANEQGRDVMAIPGSPIDPRAQGCNQLLKDGAHLVQSVEDVVDILARAQRPQRLSPAGRDHCAESGAPADFLAPPSPEPATPDTSDYTRAIHTVDPDDSIPASDPTARLLELISPTPVSIDELSRHSGLPTGVVASSVLELEISGRVHHLPGGLVQIR